MLKSNSPSSQGFVLETTRFLRRRSAWVVFPLLTSLVAGPLLPLVQAQTVLNWSGGGADDNLSSGGNWSGTAPSGSEILNFGGTTRLAPVNDLIGYGGYRIFFNSGAGTFALTGNDFTLFDFGGAAPKIENNSSSLQTINNNITLQGAAGSGVEINPVDGDLAFGGSISLAGAGNSTLKIFGNNSKSVTFNGIISESGSNGLSLLQNSTVIFGAANTYTGTTLVDAGTLRLASGGSITTSDIQVGAGATFDVNGQTATVKSISEQGGGDGGSIKLGSGSLTVNNAGAGTKYFNNLGVSGDTGSFTLNSPGSTLELYGISRYTGSTTVQAGTLNLQSTASLASSAIVISGGTLNAGGSNLFDDAASVTVNGGTLSLGANSDKIGTLGLQGGTVTGSGTLTLGGDVTSSGTSSIAPNIALGASRIFTISGGTTTASGVISGAGFSLTKAGAGKLTLTGGNTFNGGVNIGNGTLSANVSTASNSLGNNAVTLSGGVLELTPVASTNLGISGRVFNTGVALGDSSRVDFTQNATGATNGGSLAALRTDLVLNGAGLLPQNNPSNFAIQWIGKLNITGAGSYTFGTSSDDGSRLFVDGILLVNNDGAKGATDSTGAITLSAGLHDIRVDYVQGGGGAAETLSYSGPDQAVYGVIPGAKLFQAESNTVGGASNAVVLANNVNVTASSGINLNGSAFTQAQIGTFNQNTGTTLAVTGLVGKTLRVGGAATLGNGAGTVVIDSTPNIAFDGAVTDSGNNMTVTKSGGGRLIFDQTAVANTLGAGTNLNIQGGSLVLVGSTAGGAFNPIGSAGITLGGTGTSLIIDSKGATAAGVGNTYANNITVTGTGTLIQDIVNAATTTWSGSIAVNGGASVTIDAIAGGQPTPDPAATLLLTGAVSGTGSITLASSQLGTYAGVKTTYAIGNNWSGFAGNLTIGSGITVTASGNTSLVNSSVTLPGGNTLNYFFDGNGTGTPGSSFVAAQNSPSENVAFNDNFTITGSGTATIVAGRLGTTVPLFTQAQNKTAAMGSLSIGAQTLAITNNQGYGVDFTGTTTFTGNPTFSVANATNSNLIAGLTLSGKVTGNFAPTKTGSGTLLLTNGTNDFQGNITVTGGALGFTSDAALGNAANQITLNGAAGILRAYGDVSTSRTINLGNATNTNNILDVAYGKTLTLNAAFGTGGANGFAKGEDGNLILAVANPGLTGAVAINGGAIQLNNGTAAGSGAININAHPSAALLLSGGISVANAININATGGNASYPWSGINGGGALQSISGTNSASNLVTFGQDASVGAVSGATLNLTGAIPATAHRLGFVGAGSVNVSGAVGALHSMDKYDSGTTTISNTVATITSGNLNVLGGNLVLSGAGKLTIGANDQVLVSGGATMKVDDTGTPLNNRLGGNAMSITGGSFDYQASASGASVETAGVLTLGHGNNTLKINSTAQTSTITFASLTNNGGSSINFITGGTAASYGSVNNKFIFTAAPALSSAGIGILQRAFVIDGNGTNFATYNNTGLVANADGIQALTNYNIPTISSTTIAGTTVTVADTSVLSAGMAVYGPNVPAGATITSILSPTTYQLSVAATAGTQNLAYGTTSYTDINSFVAQRAVGDNVKLGAGFATGSAINLATRTFGSLNLSGGGVGTTLNSAVPNASGTYTLTSGQILSTGASTNTIGNGAIIALGTTEGTIFTDVGNTLTVAGALNSTSNFNKAGGGNLRFDAPQYFNSGGNYFSINAGTVTLAGGTNTFFPGVQGGGTGGQYSSIAPGAILELNGNSQLLGGLRSPNGASVPGSGGTIQNTGAAAVLAIGVGQNDNWGGVIKDGISLVKAGNGSQAFRSDNTYTGSTLIMGNTFTLIDQGKLSGTSAVDVNYASLAVSDGGQTGLSNRINIAADITLRGSSFVYTGRVLTPSAESFGNLVIPEGWSSVEINAGGTGVNSADVTFNSLSRPVGATGTIVFGRKDGTVLANGQIGSAPRLLFNTAPTLVNGIIPYAVSNRNWVGYNPTLGIGSLGSVGFSAYSSNTIVTGGPTDNVLQTSASVGPLGANANVNSLIFNWNGNQSIDLGSKQLALTSGALMMTTGINSTTGTISNGSITAGTAGVGGDLNIFFTPYAGTARLANINAGITNNSGGVVRTIITSSEGSGTAQTVTLNGVNSYSGGTFINQGTVNIGATGNIPAGGLTISNGTVTQTAGGTIHNSTVVTLNGGNSVMTLTGNNQLNQLVFNNNGGVNNFGVNSGGILTLTNGTPIRTGTAAPTNYESVPVVTGTIDFQSNAKTILIDPITIAGVTNIAPLTAGLNITALIQNSGLIAKTGNGNLQLSSTLSNFAGGVNLSQGGLIIGASSVGATLLGQPAGSPVMTGPVGTGTLTVASGATLLSSAANTIGNASSFGGSANFDGLNNLTLNGATTLTASTDFTVKAPQMTATLGGSISGTGFGVTKNGLGVLNLANNNNTFTGGVTLNSGTLLATGAKPFGTGGITINGGLLALKNNAGANFGNDITLSPSLTNAFIDINNNGSAAAVGNTFVFGNLNSQVTTALNVSGGNGYRLQFTGTNLTAAATPASFNPAGGLTIILPGGFNDANRPVNIGQGMLAYSGTNTFTGSTTITGTQVAAPQANAISAPYGAGNNVILSNGSTLQITPTANTLSSTGYTQGGLAGRYFSFGTAPTLNSIAASGLVPGAVVGGMPSSDTNLFNHPPGINNSGGAAPVQDIEHYVGSLNINTTGTYSFALNKDDQAAIFVDGVKIVGLGDTGVGGGGYAAGFTTGAINLSAGLHSIVVMHQNGTGGSGFQLMYSGPDTASVPGGGWQNIATDSLYYTTANASAGNGYLNAAQLNNAVVLGAGNSATLDGMGSQYNSTVASLNLGNGSTLTVNNAQGTGFIGSIGTATLGTGVTINTNSAMLNLIGGISDSGNGLTKIGTGTLMLGASAGTFTGGLSINQGAVQVTDPAALTTGTTKVGNPNIATIAGPTLTASTTVTVPSTAGLFVGEGVFVTGGTGSIPAGATITAITSPTTFTLSAAATAGTPTSLTYYGGGALDLNGVSNVTGNLIISGQGPLVANTFAPGALYNSSATAASVSGSVAIGAALNAVTPAIGGYGDINISGILSDNVAGQAWRKVGPNTLTLSGNNSFTGALTVSSGILKLGSVNSLGTSATNGVTFVANASALDLAGQSPAAAKLLTFGVNNLGVSGLAINNTLGALVNNTASTTATYSGSLTWTGALGIGSSSYDPAAPGGDIILSGTLGTAAAGIGINKVGQNTLTITGLVPTTTGGHNIQMGTLIVSGTLGAFSGGGPLNISSGATVRLDNTAGNVAAGRLGAGANGETINGNLTIIGNSNAAGTTELISTATKTLTFGNSASVVTLQPSATSGGLLFNVSSGTAFLRTAGGGATSLWRGNGLGSVSLATAAATTNTAGFGVGALANPGYSGNQVNNTGLNRGVLAWALIDQTNTGLGTSFVTYDTTNGFQPLNFATNGQTDTFATINANTLLTSSITTIANTGQQYINSLTLNNPTTPIAVTVGAGTTLPLISGGLLNLTGTAANPNTISGPGTLSVFSNNELIIHSVGTSVLNISAQIANTTGGLIKADGGTVILGAQQLYTGNTFINGGTLQLAGGNNRIFITPNGGQSTGNAGFNTSAQVFSVNQGGTFDLNGNNQMVANLTSANNLPNTGGTITNSSGTTATFQTILNGGVRTFAGAIRGNLNFIRSSGWTLTMNSASDYTGATSIQGGETILTDLGALTGTSGINLNGGVLTWTDTGSQAVTNRLPANAPLTFNTGAFTYNARNGVQGAISIGNASLNSGSSLITLTPNNGGANLTIGTGVGASLTRSVGSSVTFSGGGGIGDHTHVYLGTTPTPTNGIIGGWATAYQNDSFLGQNTQPGFAIYTTNGIQTLNPNLVTIATGNVPVGVNARANAGLTLPSGGVTLNTLSIINAGATMSFASATDTLTVTTGGILTGADNNAKSIGQSANFGQLTAGAGQSELFLHNGANTLTMNAKIIDNGVSGGLNVVADSMANGTQTLVLTAPNTYLGTTYLNNINTTLNATGGPSIPGNLVITGGVSTTDSLNATTTLAQSNQIATTSTVTLKGGATLNLAGFNNTIANLVLDNTSGDLNGVGGTVQTGGGVLTISGGITETANSNGFLVPQINGNLVLSNAAPTISIAANSINPTMVGLDLAAAISLTAPSSTPLILTGGGVIAINGQSSFTNGTNLTAGTTLAFGPAAATIGAAATFGSIASSPVNLDSGTFLDLRGNAGAIGSLSGSGTVTNLSLVGNTLTTGSDSLADTTFSGTFTNPFVQGLLGLTKIGNKVLTLSADSIASNLNSPNLGTLTVGGGGVMLNSAARVGFSTNTINSNGTLTMDNSTTPINNRLGGQFLLVSPTVATPTSNGRTLNMQSGAFNILGNNGTAITEGIGTFNDSNGGTVTLNSTGTSGVTLSVVNFGGQGGQTSLLVQGDNLGKNAPNTANSSNFTISGTFAIPGTTGGGAAGTTNMSVRGDIIALDTLSGIAGFATRDVNGLRPLNQTTELLNSTATLTNAAITGATAFNLGLSATSPLATILQNSGANTLTLLNGGGLGNGFGATGGKFGINGLQTLTLSNAGILALSGNSGVNIGAVTSGGITFDVHVLGAATNLNFNSSLINTSQGIVKAGDGTLNFNQPQFFTGVNGTNGLAINGGKVMLAGGANTIVVQPTASVPTLQSLFLNNGTLDLNGNSQAFERIASINTAPGQTNNIITSTAAANLITVPASGVTTTYAGSIGGAISLFKAGAGVATGTLILTNSNSYTGSTNVIGGTLALRDTGAITGAGAININYGTLLLDNTGLSSSTTRIPTGSAINLNGGTFSVAARQAVESQNIGTVTLAQGVNQISLSQYNNNAQTGSYSLNVANLVQTNKAVINFPNNSGVTLGQTSGNPHVFLSQVNGANFTAANLTNGILGGWAISNGSDFSSYTNVGGVTALGSNISGVAGYSANALGAGVATDNISVTATVQNVTARTINSLAVRAPGAGTTIAITGTNILNIATGGLLINTAQTVAIQGGRLTAGGAAAAPTSLYIWSNGAGLQQINTPIVNNGANAVTLVRSGGGTLTLQPYIVQTTTPTATTSLTVQDGTDLFVGMTVSGTGFAANTTITAIVGNVVTLSLAPTAGTNIQTVFTPPAIAASTTTAGSTAVTLGTAAPSGIVVGMAVGGPNIPGGTTVAAISGTSLTLSQPAIISGSGNATITIGAPSNTYTGGTINNGGSSIFGALSLNGLPGSIVIPGDLTIGNAGVTMVTNQGQIASTSNVTWVSGGTLTLVGTNTLNSLTFNGNGTSGGSGTAAVGTLLNVSAANAITSINNDLGHTPTISGAALALTNAAPVINTSGLSPDSLIISAPITAAGGRILKQGAGSVVLSATSTFTTGIDLQAGSIIFGTASVGTPPSITSGPIGTGSLQLSGGTADSTILSDGTARVIGNAVSVTGGGFTFGGTLAGHNTTLSGIVTLGAGANSINVTSPLVTGTISGQLTGGTNLTKTGNGTLTLSNATNNYGGTTTVSGGVLKVGAAGAIPDASAVTVSAGAVLDLNAFDEIIGSLAGAGLATNLGAAKTLTVGSNDTNTTFSGSIATANVNLAKIGAGSLTLTGNNTIGNVNVTRGSGNSILEFAGTGTSTAATVNVGVSGTGTATLNIKDTHTLTATNFSVGEQSGHGGTINQSGGTVTVTGAFRMGHYPTETSFYNLSSGSLNLTGTPAGVVNQAGAAEQNGVLYIGVDGTAEFAMSGGTASANAIVLDGRAANAGTDKFTITGGVFTIGANGIKAGSLDLAANIASMQIQLGGGTLAASAPWTSTLPMTLTGTGGDISFDTAGNTIGLSGVLSGSGGLKKAGAGTLTLSGANTHTGVTSVTSGTLALTAGGAIADTSVVNLTNSGSVFSISGITNAIEVVASVSGVSGSSVQLGSKTLDIGSDNTNFDVASDVSGSGGSIQKTGSGIMTLSGTNNTYTGSTNLIGGTLLLGGNNVLPNGAAFTLSTGTTLNTGGNSDVTGAFTLGGNAVIDMGSASSILSFTDVSAWTGVLSVWNWTGTPRTAGGTDQLIFTGTNGLVDLPNVNFYSGAGTGLLGGGGAVFDGTELVPVPEPGAVLTGVLLLGMIGYRERRRRIGHCD